MSPKFTSSKELNSINFLRFGDFALEKCPLRDLLIQEIIQGDNSCQFSVGVFAIEGKIIRTISANRARQHPIDFGNATTMAITCNEPELIEIANKIINETKNAFDLDSLTERVHLSSFHFGWLGPN